MAEWLEILIPSVVGLGTAVVAAYLSAKLAVRKAFQERWWERKERAYSEIVDALYESIRFCDLCSIEYLEGKDMKSREYLERYKEAQLKIEKATDVGAFVISDRVADILKELSKKPDIDWSKEPPWEMYDAEAKAYREALQKIRQLALKDLRVRC